MFEAHGTFELQVQGRILLAKFKGAWNLESALNYKREIEQVVSPLLGQPWAMVSNMNDWELFTPECAPVIIKLSQAAYRGGLVREAMVNQTDSIKMQIFHKPINGYPEFERAFFTTQDEAIRWLHAQGFD